MVKLPEVPEQEKRHRNKVIPVVAFLLFILSVILGINGFGLSVKIRDLEKETTKEVTIELDNDFKLIASTEPVKTDVLQENGQTESEILNTYEEIDGGKIDENIDLDKDALGEYYDISSPEAFMKATLDKCISMGNKYGSQCVSLARAFWLSYTDRSFSTCGTGRASGAWDCKEYNAGSEFTLIENPNELKAGDWIILNGGEYGHVGMALGTPSGNYISLLGENQGGKPCAGGGSATNIININLKNFVGAYRPNIYNPPKTPDTSFVEN